MNEKVPVLCVHGIEASGRAFEPLQATLGAAGWRTVRCMDLSPSDGSVSLRLLAAQVEQAAKLLCLEQGVSRIDVVGFSMGALIVRYWMQLLGGLPCVRRFISVSGPHQGTFTAFLGPDHPGLVEMRPGSALLAELEQSELNGWGDTEVHTFWTPLDLMIVPPSSSALAQASHRLFPIPLHPWMLTDERVLAAICEVLAA
jgi:triacylglycerol lipase